MLGIALNLRVPKAATAFVVCKHISSLAFRCPLSGGLSVFERLSLKTLRFLCYNCLQQAQQVLKMERLCSYTVRIRDHSFVVITIMLHDAGFW